MNTRTVAITIDQEFLEYCGTSTLTGMLVKSPPHTLPKNLVLVFPVAGLEYCRKNGGPKEIIMHDYVPFCLIENILELREQGVNVTIKQIEVDE